MRRPSPDELWSSTKGQPRRGHAYLSALHHWGYFSWPPYNTEPASQ